MPSGEVQKIEECPDCKHETLLALVTYNVTNVNERESTIEVLGQASDAIVCSNPNCGKFQPWVADEIRRR